MQWEEGPEARPSLVQKTCLVRPQRLNSFVKSTRQIFGTRQKHFSTHDRSETCKSYYYRGLPKIFELHHLQAGRRSKSHDADILLHADLFVLVYACLEPGTTARGKHVVRKGCDFPFRIRVFARLGLLLCTPSGFP
jgi:hypothetical protein